jgi:hypothetical protein
MRKLKLTNYVCFIGLLDALVFSQDIAVTRSLENFRIYLWKKHVNPFEEQYPHKSRNKSVILKQRRKSAYTEGLAVSSRSAINTNSKPSKVKDSIVQTQPCFGKCLKYNIIVKLFMAPNSESTEDCKSSDKNHEISSQHEMQTFQPQSSQDKTETENAKNSDDITSTDHKKNNLSIVSVEAPPIKVKYLGDISDQQPTIDKNHISLSGTHTHATHEQTYPRLDHIGLHRRTASAPWDYIASEGPMPSSIAESFAASNTRMPLSHHIWIDDGDESSIEVAARLEREPREFENIVKKL